MRQVVWTFIVAASAIVMTLPGCDGNRLDHSNRVSFVTKYAPIEFSFPAGWYVNPKEHPFDLQCFSRSQEMNTGVFVFKKADLAADSSPTDTFRQQIDDMKSKRRNFQELEPQQKYEDEEKTITTLTYLGDKDTSRYCYTFSLIEFRAESDRFAVALQVSFPGDWKSNKPILEAITRSAKRMPVPHEPKPNP